MIFLEEKIKKRAEETAFLMLEKQLTLRQAAETVGVCKSTVHKDITIRLENPSLRQEIRKLLNYHIKIRSVRGGMATRRKYSRLYHL